METFTWMLKPGGCLKDVTTNLDKTACKFVP